jgi:hypothetical protein
MRHRKKAVQTVSKLKKKIQSHIRLLAIERDGGCILRNYPVSGPCGPYRTDGQLILQGEHLVGRANSVSYADMDNIVCLCMNHHFHYKKQHGAMYWKIVEGHIGAKRWKKVQAWEADRFTPHRHSLADWIRIEEELRGRL